MKTKITKFYDDTSDYELLEETRQYMFDNYAEQEGWESIDEISDSLVYYEINELHRLEWIELKLYLDDLFEQNEMFLIKGVCGRWNGPSECGRFIYSTDELFEFIRHLDYTCFYEENGHFYIEGYHHDGRDRYELKKLTNKGREYADNNLYMNDRTVHETIMKYNLFSTLPYFSRLVGAY